MKYPNRIKELRLEMGLHQEDIYLKLGWDREKGQPKFSLLENGRRRLTFDLAQRIAAILGKTAAEVAGSAESVATEYVPDEKFIEGVLRLISRERRSPIEQEHMQSMIEDIIHEYEEHKKFYGEPPSGEVAEVIIRNALSKAR